MRSRQWSGQGNSKSSVYAQQNAEKRRDGRGDGSIRTRRRPRGDSLPSEKITGRDRRSAAGSAAWGRPVARPPARRRRPIEQERSEHADRQQIARPGRAVVDAVDGRRPPRRVDQAAVQRAPGDSSADGPADDGIRIACLARKRPCGGGFATGREGGPGQPAIASRGPLRAPRSREPPDRRRGRTECRPDDRSGRGWCAAAPTAQAASKSTLLCGSRRASACGRGQSGGALPGLGGR